MDTKSLIGKYIPKLLIGMFFISTFGFGQPTFMEHAISTSANYAHSVYAADVDCEERIVVQRNNVITIDSVAGLPGDTVIVGVHIDIDSTFSLNSYEMTFAGFDDHPVEFVGIDTSGSLTGQLGWMIYFNALDSVEVAAAGGIEMSGQGTLLGLVFAIGPDADETEIFVHAMDVLLNEDTTASEIMPGSITVLGILDIDDALIPDKFALHQNYPNPFNPITNIGYDLPENSFVSLVIYDVRGGKVRTLINDQLQEAGYRNIVWNGRDQYGRPRPSGMYIYAMRASDFTLTGKMIMLK